MAEDVKTPAEAATEATVAGFEAAADAAETAADEGKAAAKTVTKAATKAAPKAARRTARKTKTQRAKTQPKAARASASKRNDDMNFDPTKMFAGFGANPFEKLFGDVAGRGEEAVKRSRQAAEDLADMYRGNIDAFVEASKIAATGAQSIGQSMVAKSRDSIEQTADTVRSFAEAKSPTELLQLQSDFARSAFDRLVEDSSNLTESLVKLAGDAFQPISNRASANVERLNKLSA